MSPSGRFVRDITLPFLGMTWAIALIGYGFSRRQATVSGRPSVDSDRLARRPFLDALLTPSWAQPFFIFAALDLVFWQALALYHFETAIILATGNAVLLGLFAMLWQDAALAYGMLIFFLLGVGYRVRWEALPFAEAFAWVGGIGFGLYLVARVAERVQEARALAVWPKPLTNAAVFLTAVAAVVTLPAVATHTTAVAATLAFAGALYLAIAYRGRYYRLGYLGMAMLQLAWVLALIVQDLGEPQWYAIPAGLYFTGVGYLERRRRRGLFALIVESFGLAVLLVTSFIQSLNGAQGFPYFVLLLAEGLIVVWWGASRRLRVPFSIGLGASALNVVAQVVVLVNVYEVNRWFIILGVGLLLVTAAVFVERQRERIIARAQEWRDALETWE
jgi:hypothetical protein